jgi:hypothetical protein
MKSISFPLLDIIFFVLLAFIIYSLKFIREENEMNSFFNYIEDIREYDVPYYARVAIDKGSFHSLFLLPLSPSFQQKSVSRSGTKLPSLPRTSQSFET